MQCALQLLVCTVWHVYAVCIVSRNCSVRAPAPESLFIFDEMPRVQARFGAHTAPSTTFVCQPMSALVRVCILHAFISMHISGYMYRHAYIGMLISACIYRDTCIGMHISVYRGYMYRHAYIGMPTLACIYRHTNIGIYISAYKFRQVAATLPAYS